MNKVFCSLILCFILLTGCSQLQSVCVDSENSSVKTSVIDTLENGDCEFKISDQSITIVKYNGTAENIVIPGTINGLPVKAIGDSAFRNNSTIKSVVISDSVITIGASAFESCSALKTVTSGKGVEIISDFSFAKSPIEDIKIESNLKEIGRYAFSDCKNLKSINLPESVETIDVGAFFDTGITEFVFPPKIKTISAAIFRRSNNLEKVVLPDDCESIEADVFNIDELFIPDHVTNISQYAFDECSRDLVLLYDNNPLVPKYAEEHNILCFKKSEYHPVLTVELVNGKPLNDLKNLGISQEDYNLVKRCAPSEMAEDAKKDYDAAIWERTVDNSYISFGFQEEPTAEAVKQKLSKTAILLYQCGITQFDPAKKNDYSTDYLDRMTDFAVYTASIDSLGNVGPDDYLKGTTGLSFMYDDDVVAYFCGIFDFVPDFSMITGYSKQQYGIWYFPIELPKLETEVLSFSGDAEKSEYNLSIRFKSGTDESVEKTFSFRLVQHDTINGIHYRVILTGIQ